MYFIFSLATFIGANLGCRGLLSAALGLRLWAPADIYTAARAVNEAGAAALSSRPLIFQRAATCDPVPARASSTLDTKRVTLHLLFANQWAPVPV